MTIYAAWVASGLVPFGPSHMVEDEKVFEFEIFHGEGDFADLRLDVRNPRIGLLNAGRNRWLWLSVSDGTSAIPLFLGRIVGVPEQLQDEVVRLNFIARPADYETQKTALADTLRVLPYYDPVWIAPDMREDPDAVLEGHASLWHIDRVTHVLTVSAIGGAEDGVLELGDDYLRDSLNISYGASPATRANIEGEVSWTQKAVGTVDLTTELQLAFRAAGTDHKHMITSFTGEGLMADWPKDHDGIGGGWEIGPTTVRRNGSIETQVNDGERITMLNGTVADFPLYHMKASLSVRYDAERQFAEKVVVNLIAGVQPILAEPGEEAEITITMSGAVDEPMDDVEGTDGDLMPIRDQRNRTYFNTARGRQSLDALIAIGRANLISRARAVLVRVETEFENGVDLSCRKSVTIDDARLPGGTATGKVMSYRLLMNGDTGRKLCEINLGCMIGLGDTVDVVDGEPTYVVEGYVDVGYQIYDGQTIMPIDGEVTYEDFSGSPPNDDGLNFFALGASSVVESLTVINGENIQRQALNHFAEPSWSGHFDLKAAAEAVNLVFTEVDLTMVKLDTGPFETTYTIVTSPLSISKTIDLEAASFP